MRKTAWIGIVLLALALAPGCKKTPVDQKDADANASAAIDAANEDSARRDQELAELTAEQAAKLEAINAQIAAIANAATARDYEPNYMQDIGVTLSLLSRLGKEAGKQEAKSAAETVKRLRVSVSSLVANAPSFRIAQHLERAEFNLSTADLPAAGEEVLAAAGAAYNPTAAALVPDVLGTLQKASMAIEDADPAKAMDLITKARLKAADDPTVKDLLNAELTVLEAEQSIGRQAWPVLIAQTNEMTKLVTTVKNRATPTAKPAEEEPAAEPADEDKPEPATETETATDEGAADDATVADEDKPSDEGDEDEADTDEAEDETSE